MKATEWYKKDGRANEPYVACPCAGSVGFNSVGHTYSIKDCSGEEPISLGMMDLQAAKDKFGEHNIFVHDGSHTICKECSNFMLGQDG